MTTIAYKDGIIAYDSQLTRGTMITQLDYEKKKETDRYIYFLGGSSCDYESFIEAVENESPKEFLDCSGYVFNKETKKLYVYSIDQNEDQSFKIIKSPIEKEVVDSIGSGEKFAIAAMDLGKTAKEAIEYTTTRDIYTGGEIKEFKVWE